MKRSTDSVGAVSHSVIPLALAVGVVRNKTYEAGHAAGEGSEGELNMLAAFIAATVTIYEYVADGSAALRALARHELDGGLFRQAGRELRFIDGRPAKHELAVNATDVACVVSLLKDPDHAARIRSGFVRKRAQEIKAQSRQLIEQAGELRRAAAHSRAEWIAMQPDPCGAGPRARAG